MVVAINAKILHDLGNLMFAFTIFWAYLSASQLIITWPGNLPQEIGWYLDRTNGYWKVLAVIVALSMFLIPFIALLSQMRKRDPRRLMKVAVWLLCAKVIEIFWFVIPTFRKQKCWRASFDIQWFRAVLDRFCCLSRFRRSLGFYVHQTVASQSVAATP